MFIFTLLILFLMCVISEHCKVFSGFKLIKKGLGYIELLIAAMWIFIHLVLFVIVIVILLLAAFDCNKNDENIFVIKR